MSHYKYKGGFANTQGTLGIVFTDTLGKEYSITKVQETHLLEEAPYQVPGRIYFNNTLVPIRSREEENVLLILHELDNIGENSASRIIEYIKSNRYIELPQKINEAKKDERLKNVQASLFLQNSGSNRIKLMKALHKNLKLSLKDLPTLISKESALLCTSNYPEVRNIKQKIEKECDATFVITENE